MRLLVIIGCAKSGTSALARHLGTHPDMVSGRIKEPRYFTTMSKVNWSGPAGEGFQGGILTRPEDYLANFEGLAPEKWAIDASTDYIWWPETPDLLKDFARDNEVKVICVTRDPVDRAISEYNHTLRHGWETLSFDESVRAEPERIRAHWQPLFHHRRRSTVSGDLDRFRDAFGRDLLVVDYAELQAPDAMMQRISAFLDVPHRPVEEIAVKNRSFLPRNAVAARLLRSDTARAVGRALVPQALRRKLRERMHTDARNVETVKPAEIARFRDLLGDEIARCRDNPLIPTRNWTLALADA
jgi:hypothetical protein